jgi:ComF family protein
MRLLRHLLTDLAGGVINVVAPRNCHICGCSLMHGEDVLCLKCLNAVPRTFLHRDAFNTIHQRIAGTHTVSLAAGWFYYYSDHPYAALIRSAKYDDMPRLGYVFGKQYASELMAEHVLDRIDVLLPVPMHWRKRLRRGYNQTAEIARGISEVTGIPVGDNLVALRQHATQTRRNSVERFLNVKGTYTCQNAAELEGLNVLIIDDVITTGATMLVCIDAITAVCTPASINVLTLGVTHIR